MNLLIILQLLLHKQKEINKQIFTIFFFFTMHNNGIPLRRSEAILPQPSSLLTPSQQEAIIVDTESGAMP
jgi:hypothetical protein